MTQRTERRTRGGIIMAELGPEDLEAFLAECARQRRTSGFLGGQIISTWLKQRVGEKPPADQPDKWVIKESRDEQISSTST